MINARLLRNAKLDSSYVSENKQYTFSKEHTLSISLVVATPVLNKSGNLILIISCIRSKEKN